MREEEEKPLPLITKREFRNLKRLGAILLVLTITELVLVGWKENSDGGNSVLVDREVPTLVREEGQPPK